MKHPIQPVEADEHGAQRFKKNEIVTWMIDELGDQAWHRIMITPFPREDREQFIQLLGHSLANASDEEYMSEEVINTAFKMADGSDERDARIAVLEEMLEGARRGIQQAAGAIFKIEPEDLTP